MAVEAKVNADDGWFTGEDKTLRFPVSGTIDNMDLWEVQFSLYQSRSATSALFTKETGSGVTISGQDIIDVAIGSADTINLVPGTYYYVLRRVDSGANSVLAYGHASIRSAVNA